MAAKIENDGKIPGNASRALQRKGLATALFLVLALVASEGFAQDDTKFYTECAVSNGDSLTKVKQFYGIPVDPQKLEQTTPAGSSYQYHLEQYGIWVFFDELMRVSSFRFDAPFRGQIGGIAIGDTADRVRSLRGEPTSQLRGMLDVGSQKKREQQVQALLGALPDPVPKSKVLETFAEIDRIRAAAPLFNTAWVYNPNKPSFVRYEIGPDDNKVQSIMASSCSAAAAPSPTVPGDPITDLTDPPAGVFRVGTGVRPPSVISRVEPQYSDEARQAGIQGSVTLEAIVRKDGTVAILRVVKSLDPILDQKIKTRSRRSNSGDSAQA